MDCRTERTGVAVAKKPEPRVPCRLADMLRIWMTANNMPQSVVAKEIGCSESSLCRFLSGHTTLSFKHLLNLNLYLLETHNRS